MAGSAMTSFAAFCFCIIAVATAQDRKFIHILFLFLPFSIKTFEINARVGAFNFMNTFGHLVVEIKLP